MKVKIKKGDEVEIISGRLEDKGQRGEVINVLVDERRVVVQGVNLRTKHQREARTSQGRTINPGRIKMEAPISISNVMLVCPKCKKASRVGIVRDEEGSHRLCKNCQALID